MKILLFTLFFVAFGHCEVIEIKWKDTTYVPSSSDTFFLYPKSKFELINRNQEEKKLFSVNDKTDSLKISFKLDQLDTIKLKFKKKTKDTITVTFVLIPELKFSYKTTSLQANDTIRWNRAGKEYKIQIFKDSTFKENVDNLTTNDTLLSIKSIASKLEHNQTYFLRLESAIHSKRADTLRFTFKETLSERLERFISLKDVIIIIVLLILMAIFAFFIRKFLKRKKSHKYNKTNQERDNKQQGKSHTLNNLQPKVSVKLKSPENNASDLKPPIIFQWEGGGFNEFELQIATDEKFTNIIQKQKIENACEYHLEKMEKDLFEEGKTYYWRIVPLTYKNENASETFSFTFYQTPVPKTPTLKLPQNDTKNLDPLTEVKFVWSKTEENVQYIFQLSTDDKFESNVNEVKTESNGYLVNHLQFGKTYYWRVKSINQTGESDWSETFSFHTHPADLKLTLPKILEHIHRYWKQISEKPELAKDENWYLPIKKELQDLTEKYLGIRDIYYNLDDLWKFSSNPSQTIPFKPYRLGLWVILPINHSNYYVIPMDYYLFQSPDGIGFISHIYQNIDKTSRIEFDQFKNMAITKPAEFQLTNDGFQLMKKGIFSFESQPSSVVQTQKPPVKQEAIEKNGKEENRMVDEQIKKLQTEISNLSQKISSMESENRLLREEIAKLKEEIDSVLQLENDTQNRLYSRINKLQNEFQTELTHLRKNIEISQHHDVQREEELFQIKQLLKEWNYTKLSEIIPSITNELRQKQEELESEIYQLKTSEQSLFDSLNDLKNQLKLVEQQLNEQATKLTPVSQEEIVKAVIEKIQQVSPPVSETSSSMKAASYPSKQYEVLKKSQKDLSTASKTHHSQIASYQPETTSITQTKKSYDEQYHRFKMDIQNSTWLKKIQELNDDSNVGLVELFNLCERNKGDVKWSFHQQTINKEEKDHFGFVPFDVKNPKPKVILIMQKIMQENCKYIGLIIPPGEYKLTNDKQLCPLLGLEQKKYRIKKILFPAILENKGNEMQLLSIMEVEAEEIS